MYINTKLTFLPQITAPFNTVHLLCHGWGGMVGCDIKGKMHLLFLQWELLDGEEKFVQCYVNIDP